MGCVHIGQCKLAEQWDVYILARTVGCVHSLSSSTCLSLLFTYMNMICMQMICFLAVSLAYKFESEACQLQKEKSGHQMSFWNVHRIKFMTLLTRLYGCDLFQLWEPPTVAMMEDYSTLLTSVCYRFLENSAVVRDQSLLEFIADVLGLAAVKNGLTLSTCRIDFCTHDCKCWLLSLNG